MAGGIKNMGDKRQLGATDANRAGQFKPGQSGNAGGRPSIAKILASIGMTTDEARKECVETALEWMRDPKASDRSRTYAHKFIADMVALIFKQQIEVTGNVSPDALALLEAMRLTPHERRLALAQDATEDDAAFDEATDDTQDGDDTHSD